MPTGSLPKALLAIMLTLPCLSGCAHAPDKAGAAQVDEVDSLETFNRLMYRLNYGADTYVLKPITQGYRYVVPAPGRLVVTNVIDNLYSPVVFVNSVLQGDPQNSFATLWRFILNTTLGLGGTIDFASSAGLKNRPADFGETLAMYGVKSGPYVVLPLLGPSSIRDAVGRGADIFADPLTYAGYDISLSKEAVDAIDWRSRNGKLIDDIYENSIDPYETFRSAYMQKRTSDIHRAEASREKALEQMRGKQ